MFSGTISISKVNLFKGFNYLKKDLITYSKRTGYSVDIIVSSLNAIENDIQSVFKDTDQLKF